MPTEKVSTYLGCKKTPSSFFNISNYQGAEWHEITPADINTAREFGSELLNRIYHSSFLSANARALVLSTFAHTNYPFKSKEMYANSPRKESLKVSLEIFKAFDDEDSPELFPVFEQLIHVIKTQISSLIMNEDCTVAINFSEVFLLREDETPPSHFRPGIDRRVNNREDYKKIVSQFSYNLAKEIFNMPSLRTNSPRNPSQDIVAQHYLNKHELLSHDNYFDALNKPLNALQYFNCAFEAYLRSDGPASVSSNYAIFAFEPTVEMLELEAIVNDISLRQTQEIIIILRDSQYHDATKRQRVYEQTLELIKKPKCRAILQVILLTDEKSAQNLRTLAPDLHQKDGAFSPLAHEAGYYLSSPDIFAACYRKIQALDEGKSWVKELERTTVTAPQPTLSLGKACAYIYSKEETADFRHSKRLSKQQLKSNISLSLTHQIAETQALQQAEAVNQEQELSQTETLSQQQHSIKQRERTQEQSLREYSFWELPVPFSFFCKDLETSAQISLRKEAPEEQLLEQCAYFTNYYHKHHSRQHFLSQLAGNQIVRENLAATIFGWAYSNNNGKHSLVYLPNYSFDGIDNELNTNLNINHIKDGLNPSEREISESFHFQSYRTLRHYNHLAIYPKKTIVTYHTHHSDSFFCTYNIILSREKLIGFPLYISSLSLNSNTSTHAYQSHLDTYVLLREDDMVGLPITKQTVLNESSRALLRLFKRGTIYNKEQILALENQYIELITFYFPKDPDYKRILEKFISLFEEHNDDNLRIMIQIIISGHRSKLGDFLKLLTVLESRCLLEHFYKIYFKYALNISSVEDLLKNESTPITFDNSYNTFLTQNSTATTWFSDEYFPNQTIFTSLAIETPSVTSSKEWPSFEKLFHHVLLFAAKYNILFAHRHGTELKQLWRRLFAKFLIYTDHQEQEAQQLLDSLVNHLIATEGLSLAPLNMASTLLVVLEKVLDNAISKHTLKEQIEEVSGLSFLWMDTPYALLYNGFQVACSEMELHSSAINPITKRYSVSLAELYSTLETYTLGNNGLKTTLFRYLGTEALREDIAFYRELFNKSVSHHNQDDTERYIRALILGYFVATSTGIHYHARLDQDLFSNDFYTFLAKKGVLENIPTTLIATCLQVFFDDAKQTPNYLQKGTTTLWGLCLSGNSQNLADSARAIPSILTRKFEKKQLLRFILNNSDDISACIPLLHTYQPLPYLLIRATIDVQFDELSLPEYRNVPFLLLSQLYPKLSMGSYVKDIAKMDAFIKYQALFIQRGAKASLYTAFKKIIEQENNIDLALALAELLSNEMAQDETNSKIGFSVELLNLLSSKPKLLTNVSRAKPLLALVAEFYFNIQTKSDALPLLLNLCEKVINLDEVDTIQTLSILLKHLQPPECHAFLNSNPLLTAQQLYGLTQIFEKVVDTSIAIPFIQLRLQENPTNDFTHILELLKSTTQEHAKQLLFVSHFICNSPHQNSLEQLKKLTKLPPGILDQLVQLRELHAIEHQDFLEILESPSIPEAIAQYGRKQYATNLNRYNYDHKEIAEKISHIKYKPFTDDEDCDLNDETQKKLVLDYKRMMSYMMINPVLIEQDDAGVKKSFTINQLNEAQCQTLFKQLQTRITNHENKHQHELMLIALSCEALYRTTHKFPRNTQILSLLNSLHQEGNLIHELKTGEGKSIIAALHGVLLMAEKRTVDIATENDQLAREGLSKFKRFYHYLGVPCSTSIIEAQSPHKVYIENGLNYSTAAGFSLFRTQMQLENNPLPHNVSSICDEIDATLTTTVQYRLAATINPLLHDKKSWPLIYKQVLDFVKEKEIFLNNKCSKEDDIQNFKQYLLLKTTEKTVNELINKLPSELISSLIDSAMIAHELEEDIDYMVVTKTSDKTYHYAAPILESTKRPDRNVSYSACVQQLLHIRLNNHSTPLKYPFEIEPSTDTLVVVSAKNFFDYYRLNGGRTIGFTGTAGTRIELKEFFQENALRAFSYPTFRKERCNNAGFLTAIGLDDHHQAILQKVHEHKKTVPEQPILIITSSPKTTLQLAQFLASNNPDWSIQSYCGYEEAGCSEEHIITLAGQNKIVTIATQSLARGTDIDPLHEQGLFVINTCIDLTESDLRQIQGRAARNGKPGQFCSIINAEKLGSQLTTHQAFIERFKEHQQHLTLTKQKDRLKTRLLEEVRHHIVSHFLDVRARADTILSKQYGRQSSLIPSKDFLQTISAFNQNTERQYMELLDNHPCLDDRAMEVFFEGRINEYQCALNRWLPEEKFQHFKAVEPLIPLENLTSLTTLNTITMDQLGLLSHLLSTGWKEVGHQQMQDIFARLDILQETFKPYFKKEKSFQYVLLETLQNQHILDTTDAVRQIDALEKGLLDLTNLSTDLPIIGRFITVESIKRFISDYFRVTKKQIHEKKWDDLALPAVDMSGISLWWNRISTLIMLGSVFAGPIPFIVKRILIPIIGTWVTSLFKTQLATSKSTSVQMLLGLSDLSSDLSNAVTALISTSKSETMTLGILLDSFTPLLKNKGFLSLMTTLLELNDRADLIPYLKAIPELLVALEPYRESKLNDVLNIETTLSILQKASQFEFVKKALDETEYKERVIQLVELKPDFISAFHHLSFPEFLGLLKVIAHPNFFDFLNTLPPQTTFAELNLLLITELDSIPPDIKVALSELKHYQSNREKIAEDSRQSLLTLKEKFMISGDTLKTELARLAPKPQTTLALETISPQNISEANAPETPWLTYGAILIGFAVTISLNILFFSVNLLLTSIVLISLFSYPIVRTYALSPVTSKSVPNPDQKKAPLPEKPAEPILVRIIKPTVSAPERVNIAQIDSVASPINDETFGSAAYKIYGLFNQPKETDDPTSFSDETHDLMSRRR